MNFEIYFWWLFGWFHPWIRMQGPFCPHNLHNTFACGNRWVFPLDYLLLPHIIANGKALNFSFLAKITKVSSGSGHIPSGVLYGYYWFLRDRNPWCVALRITPGRFGIVYFIIKSRLLLNLSDFLHSGSFGSLVGHPSSPDFWFPIRKQATPMNYIFDIYFPHKISNFLEPLPK